MNAYVIGEIEITDPAVLLEFPSYEQTLKWYRSPEYAPLITLRQKASRGRLVLAEGS
jgi:uncharacterized protein (DUF1330 family)